MRRLIPAGFLLNAPGTLSRLNSGSALSWRFAARRSAPLMVVPFSRLVRHSCSGCLPGYRLLPVFSYFAVLVLDSCESRNPGTFRVNGMRTSILTFFAFLPIWNTLKWINLDHLPPAFFDFHFTPTFKSSNTKPRILSLFLGLLSATRSVNAVSASGISFVREIPAFLKNQTNAKAPLRLFPSVNG